MSRRPREMYCGHARLCVCLSAAARPHYCTYPDVTWGSGRECPLGVHYWADLQSVHGLRCLIDWVEFNVPLNTLQVIPGTGFTGKWLNQQCQSTEGSNGPKDQASIPPGPSHNVTILHSQTQNNTYTKMNLNRVKWAQWDKTQSRELLVLFICMCSSLCTIVTHNTAQNRPDNFPSCPPDNHHCSDDVYLRERGVGLRCYGNTIKMRGRVQR